MKLPQMDNEIKEMWIKALESGEYEQTKSKLRDDKGFCCLGVLCDLYHKQTGLGEWVIDPNRDSVFEGPHYDFVDEDSEDQILPESVVEWAKISTGIDDRNPLVPREDGVIISLAEFNDNGYNFHAIAALIKSGFKGVE